MILCAAAILVCFFYACNNSKPTPPPQHELVTTPEQMKEKVPEIIKKIIDQIDDNGERIDSITVLQPMSLQYLYDKNGDEAKWSRDTSWTAGGKALIKFIGDSRLYGLFPEDYHYNTILSIDERVTNTEDRKDAVLWSKADLLLTDALLQIIKDVKLGRLQRDSISLRSDSMLSKEFNEQQVDKIVQSMTVARFIDSLEPVSSDYRALKEGIKGFLDSAQFKNYTYIPYPINDSAKFKTALQARLFEEGLTDSVTENFDPSKISKAIKKYQEKKKLTADGKVGGETIRSLNLTDKEKFIRIALSLDKYKMLPDKMPVKYVWVNLAGYYMQLRDSDSVKINSKVVVGKPLTRTPELTSAISEMITYPQWSVPQSIIIKEFLPELKKDAGYLAKKGFSLLNQKNEEVDPFFVDWSKYKKTVQGIPYKIVQGSGDDNALGVMKFNFPNKYAVYLHDTNQRYLFAQSTRALSHGCVRVQQWEKLTDYILKNDSASVKAGGSRSFIKADSVSSWLTRKEKHFIPVRNKIPVFIRYFTCEGHDGKIIFYDDIYNEDQMLGERYFAKKIMMPETEVVQK
jgi:murein L,D-transpeptidase YcbB/YkuD